MTSQQQIASYDDNGAVQIAKTWLSPFSAALCSGAVDEAVTCFHPDGWLRDSLIFSWTPRSLHGYIFIRDYLASSAQTTLVDAHLDNVRLNTATRGLTPQFVPLGGKIGGKGVGFAFSFEAPNFLGRAYALLRKNEAESHWKAVFVFMQMDEIKGYPPCGPESGVYGGHTLAWRDVWAERKRRIETEPYVLIIGAGQNGLNLGARLKNLNIPTLIIDRHPRVGDQWRIRYPTLALHTPRAHHSMIFQPYPKTWPIFTPTDKVADWLEQFPKVLDLVVWTNTTLESSIKPVYDTKSRRWNLAVTRDGKEVVLHPAHIVVATGALGSPRVPAVRDKPLFMGSAFHASQFHGAEPFKSKRVLVVGAGNTGADIAQDCVTHGAQEVTILQRSSTCTISIQSVTETIDIIFPEGEDTEVSDFKYQAYPIGLQRQWGIEDREKREKKDGDLFKKLVDKGVKLNQGMDGSGQHLLVYERWGGFWVDVGIGELIDSGSVKVVNGVELERFVPDGVIFTNGNKLTADVVIYATGYHSSRDDLRLVFGEDVMARTNKLELNEEDEVGMFKPSGQPGLWFAGGDFALGRALSKQLALQIQARQLGLISEESLAPAQHTRRSYL